MNEIGLVLEGGGMRGLYTAGVLEFFMEREVFFPYVIGVSAGACMAASYLSRQKGRNKEVNTGLVTDHRFLSFRNFIKKRELFGMDFLFDEIPNTIIPFDFPAFLAGPERFIVGTTDCETGQAIYYNKHDHGQDILQIIRASSSLPFIAPVVEYNGKKLLDGGITDPIPIQQAKQDGFTNNVVILTKQASFQKQPSKLYTVLHRMYRRHPKIADLLGRQYQLYNEALSVLHTDAQNGNCFIIQPSVDVPISRIERKQQRLIDLYELGYNDAKRQFSELTTWMEQKQLTGSF